MTPPTSTEAPSSTPDVESFGAASAPRAAPDAHLLEQTKQQIRSLVAEIAQLTKLEVAPEEFYRQFLDRVVSALAAVGGAVWTLTDDARLTLQYQINLQQTGLQENELAQSQHGRLLGQVLSEGEPVLVPPHSGTGEQQAANPTDFLLICGLLKTDVETVGLVEVFQRNDGGPATQRGYLRFVAQICELAGDFLKSHQLRHFSHRQVLWTQLEDFCRVVHASLDPRTTAYTIANEGRRLIECDRLSVAIRKGRRCVIEAVSGQDVFDRRANGIRLLERLATKVTAAGEAVWYTGDTRDLPPQVEEALQQYVDESHSKTVAILPLKRPEPEADDAGRRRPAAPLGALIVERIEDSRAPASMQQRVDVVLRHSATALTNALEYRSLFLLPLWRVLGKSRVVVALRNLPLTLAIGGLLTAVVLFLCLWPATFGLESKGTLEPVIHRNVYAGAKGRVTEVLVQHGDQVTADQPLVRLRDTEVEMGLTEIEGQRVTTGQRIVALERVLLEPKGMAIEERNRMAGELAEAKEKSQTLDAQWKLYQQKQRDLELTSPIDGQIVTWDVANRLKNVPVQRGQTLLQVADPSGDWQLELRMPDQRMGYVAKAQQEFRPDLDVEFQLATDPGQTFKGRIVETDLSAELHGEEGNTVLIRVAVDKAKLPHLRPGTTVTARVLCGQRPLGYVWFHDVWAFVQSRIIFRYF